MAANLLKAGAPLMGSSVAYKAIEQAFMSQAVKNPDLRSSKETFAYKAGMGIAHYFITRLGSQSKSKAVEPKFNWDYEADPAADKTMKCDVSVRCRPTCAGIAHHMSLLFEYEDGEKRVYEATNEYGKLIPSWYSGTTVDTTESTKFTERYFSRHQVNLIAKKNKFNGKSYIPTFVNCQTWAQELLANLGLELSLLSRFINYVPVLPNVINIYHYLKENIDCKAKAIDQAQQVVGLDYKAKAKGQAQQVVSLDYKAGHYIVEELQNFLEQVTLILNNSLKDAKQREDLLNDPIAYIIRILLNLLITVS